MGNDFTFAIETIDKSVNSLLSSFAVSKMGLLPLAKVASKPPKPLPTEAIVLRTTPQILSELLRDYLWSLPFVGNIYIDTENQFKIRLSFRVWLGGNRQSDERVIFTMTLRSPSETLVWIKREIHPLRLHLRPSERGFYQRSIHFFQWGFDEFIGNVPEDCGTEYEWIKPLSIESLETALEIALPGFIKSCFPELYNGPQSQHTTREDLKRLGAKRVENAKGKLPLTFEQKETRKRFLARVEEIRPTMKDYESATAKAYHELAEILGDDFSSIPAWSTVRGWRKYT